MRQQTQVAADRIVVVRFSALTSQRQATAAADSLLNTMLARRAVRALSAAAIARWVMESCLQKASLCLRALNRPKREVLSSPAERRPASACPAALAGCVEALEAATSLAAAPGHGQPAAPPARLGSTGDLCSSSSTGGLLLSSAEQLLFLSRSLSSSTSSSSSSSSSGSVQDRSGLSEAQLQTAAEQLMQLSRSDLKQPQKSANTDASTLQRMALLLRLGFSQATIEAAIRKAGGGPYIAEQHIGEAVALLRRWGFSQEQLDKVLAGSTAFTRSAADIVAVLAWLQQEFGLQQSQVALACSRAPSLLEMKQETLQANWGAFEAAYQPAATAKTALAAVLRAGHADFLLLKPETIR